MKSGVTILEEFKNNLIDFLDELIQQFPDEANFVIARIFIKDRVSPSEIMNHFIQHIVPLEEYIKNRDEQFFLDGHVTFFNNADQNTVNHFKRMWKSSRLDASDREIIWQWFDTFLSLANLYIKSK